VYGYEEQREQTSFGESGAYAYEHASENRADTFPQTFPEPLSGRSPQNREYGGTPGGKVPHGYVDCHKSCLVDFFLASDDPGISGKSVTNRLSSHEPSELSGCRLQRGHTPEWLLTPPPGPRQVIAKKGT
jgi:hypothetical protein